MNKKVRTFCNRCNDNTNHTILFGKKVVTTFSEDDPRFGPLKEQRDYMVVQCKGCNSISFLLRETGDAITDQEGNPDCIDYNFPEKPEDDDFNYLSYEELDSLPGTLADLYDELMSAFQNGSNKLAGVGLRMLVEAICIEQNITGQNLKVKIEGLQAKGLISKNETPILDKLREVGNASAHGIKQFPLDKLQYALEILNHVLKSIYILPKINKKLKL